MGTPRKQRRTYSRPKAPFTMQRIVEEKEICNKYGLKNRKELWKAKTELARIRTQAKKLQALKGEDTEQGVSQLMSKLNRLGINCARIDDILVLKVENLLERRLQTVVFKKGIASTPKQARQYIAHNHIIVLNHRVTVPGYMVKASEEDSIRLEEEFAKRKSSEAPEKKQEVKPENA
jgi:small subunit ribosomal protein S4